MASNAPINIATARAARKRRKLTGQQFKDARDSSRIIAGYDSTSPIWGKPTLDVLIEIADELGKVGTPSIYTREAMKLNEELRKRFLSYKLTGEEIESTK